MGFKDKEENKEILNNTPGYDFHQAVEELLRRQEQREQAALHLRSLGFDAICETERNHRNRTQVQPARAAATASSPSEGSGGSEGEPCAVPGLPILQGRRAPCPPQQTPLAPNSAPPSFLGEGCVNSTPPSAPLAPSAAATYGLTYSAQPPPQTAQAAATSSSMVSLVDWRSQAIDALTAENPAVLQSLASCSGVLWTTTKGQALPHSKIDFGRVGTTQSKGKDPELAVVLRNTRPDPVIISELIVLPNSGHFKWYYAVVEACCVR